MCALGARPRLRHPAEPLRRRGEVRQARPRRLRPAGSGGQCRDEARGAVARHLTMAASAKLKRSCRWPAEGFDGQPGTCPRTARTERRGPEAGSWQPAGGIEPPTGEQHGHLEEDVSGSGGPHRQRRASPWSPPPHGDGHPRGCGRPREAESSTIMSRRRQPDRRRRRPARSAVVALRVRFRREIAKTALVRQRSGPGGGSRGLPSSPVRRSSSAETRRAFSSGMRLHPGRRIVVSMFIVTQRCFSWLRRTQTRMRFWMERGQVGSGRWKKVRRCGRLGPMPGGRRSWRRSGGFRGDSVRVRPIVSPGGGPAAAPASPEEANVSYARMRWPQGGVRLRRPRGRARHLPVPEATSVQSHRGHTIRPSTAIEATMRGSSVIRRPRWGDSSASG